MEPRLPYCPPLSPSPVTGEGRGEGDAFARRPPHPARCARHPLPPGERVSTLTPALCNWFGTSNKKRTATIRSRGSSCAEGVCGVVDVAVPQPREHDGTAVAILPSSFSLSRDGRGPG